MKPLLPFSGTMSQGKAARGLPEASRPALNDCQLQVDWFQCMQQGLSSGGPSALSIMICVPCKGSCGNTHLCLISDRRALGLATGEKGPDCAVQRDWHCASGRFRCRPLTNEHQVQEACTIVAPLFLTCAIAEGGLGTLWHCDIVAIVAIVTTGTTWLGFVQVLNVGLRWQGSKEGVSTDTKWRGECQSF